MRLIDADVLRGVIEESRRKNPHKDDKIALNHDMEHRAFCSIVASQPTAFDQYKVLEQLEKRYAWNEEKKKEAYYDEDWGKFDFYTNENRVIFWVIKIVKGGGVNV